MSNIEIKTLTAEQIETLQVDEALRLLGKNTVHLTYINNEIRKAILDLGQARIKLDQLKQDKDTIIEINRALKTITERA